MTGTGARRVFVFVGEFFGVLKHTRRSSWAAKVGSVAASFAYSLIFAGLLASVITTALPGVSESVAQRLAKIAGLVLWIGLTKEVPVMPRVLRLGMIPAFAFIGFRVYVNQLD